MMVEMKLGLLSVCSLSSADGNVAFLLVIAQKLRHIFCCSVLHVELMERNLLKHSIQQFGSVTNIMDCLSLAFQDSLSQYWHVFVKGYPEHLSSSTDVPPFETLKPF
jgi:hypothetical protein